MAEQKKRNWTRLTLIIGTILTAVSMIPIAMISMPGVSLDTTQGLIYMFSLPVAGTGLVVGILLLALSLILALVGLFKR